MAEAGSSRSVSVALKVDVKDYVAGLDRASKATKDFAATTGKISGSAATSTKQLGDAARKSSTDIDKAAKSTKDYGDTSRKASQDVDKVTKSTKDTSGAARDLGAGMAVAGAAIAAGIGLAVKAFADFDKEMSNVRAVSGATAGEMTQLRDAALAAGAATKFSASDAATAEAELVKAGISVKDVLGGGLNGALSLAAAGNLDLANAATVSANAMNIFGLAGKDVGHIADVLAAGANKSAADVDQLAQAMQQSGLVASQMGLSLEETVGILSAFADNGLKGSDAGTSLKTMLQRLVPSSDAAAQAMKDIGFSAFDAQGNMKSLDVIAGDLQKGLSGLTEKQKAATLNTIFGSDAVRAANVAFKLGTKGVQEYTDAVNDQGAAARVAAVQMDNLAGDMENLRGSIETALIKGGSGANDALRGIAQAATGAVNAFGELPDSMQKTIVGLAAVASGALLMGGALITAVPKIKATKEALDALAVSAPRAAGALKSVSAVAATLTALSVVGPEVQRMWDGIAGANDDATRSLESYLKAGRDAAEVTSIMRFGFGDLSGAVDNVFNTSLIHNARAFFDELGTGFGLFGGSATDDSISFFKQIDQALTGLVQSGKGDQAATVFKQIAAAAKDQGYSLDQVRSVLPGYAAAVDGAAVANGTFADSTDSLAGAAGDATGKGKLLGDELKAQKDAAKDAQAAYDALTKSIKDYGSALDADLAAESAFESSLDTAAERVQKRAEIQSQIAKLQKEDAKGNAAEIARLKAQLSDYAATLDLGTKAGRDNVASLRDIAKNAKDVAVANFENGASVGEVAGQMDKARAKFIEQAKQYGATSEQAKYLADNLGLTRENVEKLAASPPADVRVDADVTSALAALNDTSKLLDATDGRVATATVTADTSPADTAIADTGALLDATDARTATATISADAAKALTDANTFDQLMSQIDGQTAKATIQVAYERVGPSLEAITGLADGSLGFKGFAEGGYTGRGGKYDVAGVVHAGEYVFTKDETNRAGVANLAALARSLRGYADGGLVAPRFADRGMVSSAMSTTNQYGGNVTNDRRIQIDKVVAADVNAIEREADRRRRLDRLGTRRGR